MTVKATLNITKNALLISLLLNSIAFAQPNPPHTWHTISTTSGIWEGKLQMLNQGGQFVTPHGSIINDFTISPSQSLDYGFSFDSGADFDIAYTLTLVENSDKQAFQSKACVFVITASGPAQPDVRVSSFNGAKCNWHVIHGRGENFVIA